MYLTEITNYFISIVRLTLSSKPKTPTYTCMTKELPNDCQENLGRLLVWFKLRIQTIPAENSLKAGDKKNVGLTF